MRTAFVLLLMVGCSRGSPVDEPRPAAAITAAKPLEILPVASASAAAQPAEPTWKVGGVIAYMPARCDTGRVYLNLDRLLRNGGAASLERLVHKDRAPTDERSKALRAIVDGLSTAEASAYAALKEVAICAQEEEQAVVALRIDVVERDRLADHVSKAVEKAEGKAPKVERAGDFVWIESSKGRAVAVGQDLLLAAHSRTAIESGLAGSGASDFAGASAELVWAHMREKDAIVKLREVGDDLDFQLDLKLGPSAATFVRDWSNMSQHFEGLTNDPKLAPLKPLVKAAQRARLQAEGERVLASTRMPLTVIVEVLQGLVDSPGL